MPGIPSVSLPGFIGGTYQARTPLSQAEECINLFPENDMSGTGRATMYTAPGLVLYVTLPTAPVQGQIETNYRTFAVSGRVFYEIFDDQTAAGYGSVGFTPAPVSMATNWRQILIVADHKGWIFDLATNVLTQITDPGFPLFVTNVTCIDGYFVVGEFNSRRFYLSALNDGTIWSDGSGIPFFATKEGAPDNIVSVIATRRTVVLLGFETAEVWVDSGGTFPFTPINGALLQQGNAAVLSPAVLEDGVYWLGTDARGNGQVWANTSLSATRISDFAIETFLGSLSSINDAVGMTYQEGGHVFYSLHFPQEDKTICFDRTVGKWHKRGSWDSDLGIYHAAVARFHSFSFVPIEHRLPAIGVRTDGIHLVGDYRNGNLYIQSMDFYTDNGAPKRWLRRAPNLINQNQINTFWRLELFCQVGGVPLPPAPGSAPIVSMRYSDDGGITWSNIKAGIMPKTGKYKGRVIWRQLGSGRDRVFEISGSDPIPIALVDFFVRLSAGNA